MTRITLACPQVLFTDYLQLRRCLLPSRAEAEAPPDPLFAWRDKDGAVFAVASAEVGADWLARLQAPLVAPGWGADMAAAERAQARLALWSGDGPAPVATAAALTVVAGLTGAAALAAIGLQPLAEDPPI